MKPLMNWTSGLFLATCLVLADAAPSLARTPAESETSTKTAQKSKSATKAKTASTSKASTKSKTSKKAKSEKASPLGKVQKGDDTYKVVKGDTVLGIAERLRMTPETLIKMNGLKKPYTLKVGRILKVPAAKVYVIKPGDSLYAISKRFSVDVDSLKALNNTGSNATIKPGQKIELPAEARDLVAEAEAAAEKQLAAEKAEAARLAKKKEAARLASRRDSSSKPSAATPATASAPPAEPTLDLSALGIKRAEPSRDPGSTQVPAQNTPTAYAPPPTPRPIFPPPNQQAAAPSSQASILDPAPAPPTEAEIAASGRGRFLWPIRGTIISDFGPKDAGQRNDGINIAGREGDIVKSAAAGDVVYSGNLVPGFGNLVLIKHDGGWVTAYAHMSRILVKIKDRVAQGQDIGAVGSTGGVTSPQLHFELRYAPSPKEKARPVDPALVMPR